MFYILSRDRVLGAMENDYKKLTHRWKSRSSTLQTPCKFIAHFYHLLLHFKHKTGHFVFLHNLLLLKNWFGSGNCILSSRLLFYSKVGSTLLQKEQKVKWPCGCMCCWTNCQTWKDWRWEIPLQQNRYKSRSFFSSVIYSSLIHRPEHLRLVLNCCFELVEVGSKILGRLGTSFAFEFSQTSI